MPLERGSISAVSSTGLEDAARVLEKLFSFVSLAEEGSIPAVTSTGLEFSAGMMRNDFLALFAEGGSIPADSSTGPAGGNEDKRQSLGGCDATEVAARRANGHSEGTSLDLFVSLKLRNFPFLLHVHAIC